MVRSTPFQFVRHLLVLLAGMVLLGPPLPTIASGTLTLEATFTSVDYGWERVERWQDTRALFQPEDYLPDGRNDQSGQRRRFFGSARPHSSRFLLYHAPGWDAGSRPVPVLLVHGANHNADRAWAAPDLGNCGASRCPATGMMQYLSERGYRLFAINFPHMHGDNHYWAEQIHDAIEIIRAKTGASQVDVIAWSKGGFAARQYASSVHKEGGTPYSGNIRRLILLGAPNKGIDYTFRHGINGSIGVYPECGINANAPAAHTWLVCYGAWYSHPEMTIYTTSSGNFFPGQKQMLHRWDDRYAPAKSEQDWHTTYYGGWGFVSYSPGIDHALSQGSLVATIRNSGIPRSIETYLLCGGANDIPDIHNEHTGASDGLLFVASCSDSGGIGTVGERIIDQELNHLELGWHDSVLARIDAWLSR